jgi:hypothetical protein
MAQLAPKLRQRFFDANGEPLVGGKLYSYQAGTSTPLDTYTDQSESTANANPVILDSEGYADVWCSNNNYKFVLADTDDNILWTVDDISPIADGVVTTSKLVDGSVTTAKLADLAVTTAKLNNLSVTNAKMAFNSVGEFNIIQNSIFPYHMGPGNFSFNGLSSGSFSTTSATAVFVTNMTATITTYGRPVKIELLAATSGSYVRSTLGSTLTQGYLYIVRDSTSIVELPFDISKPGSGASSTQITLPPSVFHFTDFPAAGTYTYELFARGAGSTLSVVGCFFLVREV